jgi:hypothetical protein
MNESEESDCDVVPMNQPNKVKLMEEDLYAEAGEGRARTKENIGQDHTSPTQGGNKGVSQGLAGVRQAARARKEERFSIPYISRRIGQ